MKKRKENRIIPDSERIPNVPCADSCPVQGEFQGSNGEGAESCGTGGFLELQDVQPPVRKSVHFKLLGQPLDLFTGRADSAPRTSKVNRNPLSFQGASLVLGDPC